MRFFARPKFYLRFLLFLILLSGGLWYFFKIDRHFLTFNPDNSSRQTWGITFSRTYAQALGLDWRQAYIAMLDDLHVRHIRLPVYWSDIEQSQGTIDYSDYDWMVSEGQKRGVDFIIVLGRRLPRWPECHTPAWTVGLSEEEMRTNELKMISATVKHFNENPAVASWQAENEYFVDWFGSCPKGDKAYLQSVIDRIRLQDSERPIYLTDSGEFSTWGQVSQLSQHVGTTMYRVAWNPYIGYTYTPWPAWLYRLKAQIRHLRVDQMIVAELQAEPWPTSGRLMQDLTATEIEKSFPLKQLYSNAEVARRTGFAATYFWGAEWWYLRLTQGDAQYWQAAKEIMQPVYEK